MLEKDIEKMLVGAVKEAGGIAYKFTSPGNNGVPDRIVCLPGGYTIFVELKTDTGRLTALQQRQIERLRKTDQTVEVIYGLHGLIAFLDNYGMHEEADRLRSRYDL